MPCCQRTGIGTVGAVVGLIVAAFAAANIMPMIRDGDSQRAGVTITEDSVPRIEALVAARRGISGLRLAYEQIVHDDRNATERVGLRATVDQLRGHVDEYLALHHYAAVCKNAALITAGTDAVEKILEAIGDGRDSSIVTATRPVLAATLEYVDAVLLVTIDLNARSIRKTTRHMEHVRARSRREALILTAVSMLFAVALFAWAVRTIGRRQAAESAIKELLEWRAEELDAFAARVAHDLVSPLTPAALWLEYLEDHSDEKVRRAASASLRGVHQARRIVDGLLAFARARRGAEPQATSEVGAVAREVVAGLEGMRREAEASLDLRCEPAASRIAVHEGVLASILANLIGNALKYLGDSVERKVEVQCSRVDGVVRIEVRDTGPGIPPETQQRIFEPYFRGAPGGKTGLGLGLATVKRLVEAHRGRVGVESSPCGSTFWVELPAATTRRQHHGDAAPP